MDLVEDIDFGDIGVRAIAEGIGEFGGETRVFSCSEGIGGGDYDRVTGLDSCPSGVDFGGWRLAVDGKGVGL